MTLTAPPLKRYLVEFETHKKLLNKLKEMEGGNMHSTAYSYKVILV